MGNSSLPHARGHSAACAWGCVTGRPACPFFPRACIAHQRFLPIMYRSNGMPPTWGARRWLWAIPLSPMLGAIARPARGDASQEGQHARFFRAHARGHSAARARGCVMGRPARPVTASRVCARFPAAATACRARWPHPRFVTRYIAPGHVSPAAFMSVPDISLRQIPMLLQIGIKIQIRRVGSLFIHLTFVPALERHAY